MQKSSDELPNGVNFNGSLSRFSVTPPTVIEPATSMSTEPAVVDVIWTVHEPVFVRVRQVLPLTNVAPAVLFLSEKVSVVPAGTLAQPVPSLTSKCPVRVWLDPTSFVAVCSSEERRAGKDSMLAVSQSAVEHTAGVSGDGSVSRLSVTPPTGSAPATSRVSY